MPSIGRNKIHSLSPLTSKQLAYLAMLGERAANNFYNDNEAWWLEYFSPVGGTGKLPFDAWEDPGYDISNKRRYFNVVDELASLLQGAKTNRRYWQDLMQAGGFPPNPPKDPYTLPAYFTWWQAENAFRRGFVSSYEARYFDEFKEQLKNRFRSDGNILTRTTMDALSSKYNKDPFIALYFLEMIQNVDSGKPSPFSSLKAMYNDLLQRREKAYEQFSPYFQPLRWAPGAGLVGIEEE